MRRKYIDYTQHIHIYISQLLAQAFFTGRVRGKNRWASVNLPATQPSQLSLSLVVTLPGQTLSYSKGSTLIQDWFTGTHGLVDVQLVQKQLEYIIRCTVKFISGSRNITGKHRIGTRSSFHISLLRFQDKLGILYNKIRTVQR